MKQKTIYLVITACCLFSTFSVGFSAFASPAPQYSERFDPDKVVIAYYLENGEVKNIRITVQNRRLKSFWNGREWVLKNGKVEPNRLSESLTDDASEQTKFLAKLPYTVDIDNVHVYFDPDAR